MKTPIIYEFPFNEKIRIFIRLEQLLLQLDYFMNGATVFDKRAAVSALINVFMIISRNDIKSELLKEIDSHTAILHRVADNKVVDTDKLNAMLDNLNAISEKLHQTNGKIGSNITENTLFQSIVQRNSIPGGTCSFDLPAFHYWLEQNNNHQTDGLSRWAEPLATIKEAIGLVLDFIRQSGAASNEIAESGFFQSALSKTQPYQLLRITIDNDLPYFAEISGGKHRFTIRFMQLSADQGRATQINQNVSFSLALCVV